MTQVSVEGALGAAGVTTLFDHCAVAAPRLVDLLAIYKDLLGGRYVVGGDNPRVGYRAVQLGFADGSRIELMEPLAGSTFFDRFFAKGGGLHHVTFKVSDVEVAIGEMARAGFTPTAPFLDDESWREVFFHPREASGVLVQLAQAGPGHEAEGGALEEVLAGRGSRGNREPSPGYGR